MTLSDYVLTYKRQGEETPVVSIEEYYEQYVKPLSPAYARSSFKSANTVVCCFHDDINPSLGTIKHKHLKGVRVFHCFGCGAAGTVIEMHQRVVKQFYHRTISEQESALELCDLFGLDATEYKNVDQKQLKRTAYLDKLRRIQKAMSAYTLREFQSDIMEARKGSASVDNKISLINMACIKMTATKKKLFDD